MAEADVKSYSVIVVKDPKSGEEDDLFIGRLHGERRLLGTRPSAFRYLFTERECTIMNKGKVTFPEGRAEISDLVEGDIITVTRDDGNAGPCSGAIYQRRR
ncbi:hypothetical protein HY492_01500 [Candidatus Woesearchaeota archaeon]|nr:hypothetical protein [Candidatus Woesearchaeota archaeon]